MEKKVKQYSFTFYNETNHIANVIQYTHTGNLKGCEEEMPVSILGSRIGQVTVSLSVKLSGLELCTTGLETHFPRPCHVDSASWRR